MINKSKIVFFIILFILIIILILYLFTRINENNIEIGPLFNYMLSGNRFIYKRAKPKKAIKNIDFREETNAAFNKPPDAPVPPDSLNDLASGFSNNNTSNNNTSNNNTSNNANNITT